VLLAHHLLAYFEMLERDVGRFHDCFKRTDVLPLGSGALAGVSYDVDREAVARELGFNQVSCNSMDAVSDRDFVVEFQAAAAIAVMHLSRLGEELVVWSSAEFSLVEIDDAYATGSSIMPQKKNPDVAELARGKTGRVYGHLISILTTLKGLPLSYNRDLQEDKEGLFDTVYTINATFQTFAGMVKTLKINRRRCEELTGEGYLLATDFADYLVKKGIPFREAHAIVCRLVRYAEDQGKSLHQLDPEEYKQFSPLFEEDVRDITTASALVVRDVTGGTAPKQVEEAIKRAKRILEAKI
jgi:argininosuccinate lyase